MNIDQVLSEYDAIESTHDFNKIESFILGKMEEAKEERDGKSLITLYNEILGLYREFSHYDRLIECCRDLLILMEEEGIVGTLPYATSLLNIANAVRSAGLHKESMVYYNEVLRIYDSNLSSDDPMYAPVYNNMALLFEEIEDYMSAIGCLNKALRLARKNEDSPSRIAISLTNLAMCLLKADEYGEAIEALNEAFRIFDAMPETDYHYGAALSAMAEARYKVQDYEASAEYYEKALSQVKVNTGIKSRAYEVTLSNLKQASDMALKKKKDASFDNAYHYIKGLDLSRAFYEEFGAKMIHEKFPEYESRIAVGLAGEGSECEGFDDESSMDHDFGPGFCIWLSDETYEKIGKDLEKAYEDLPVRFKGITRLTMATGRKRVGVFKINDWYQSLLGIDSIADVKNYWTMLEDSSLRKATNGEIFRDDEGLFSKIRMTLMSYYPENVRLLKLSQEISLVSQYGQYNYERMLNRKDGVTASIALANFAEHAMNALFLLDKCYAPFYKWKYRALKNTESGIIPEFEKLFASGYPFCDDTTIYQTGRLQNNEAAEMVTKKEDAVKAAIQRICEYILKKMKEQGLTDFDSDYLDHHTMVLLRKSMEAGKMGKEELITKLVGLEWEAFDKVQNEGGRASCQNNFPVFNIMRRSQYMTWDEEMLESYILDFEEANKVGWNLITEKYGRMEASTAPEKWEQLKDSFPPISEEKKAIIESIVALQTGMMDEFAKEYPKSAGNARSIHTLEDNANNTSYETYLRGEISTYSDQTLMLYGRFIAGYAREGKSLPHDIIGNTALLYGYKSLEDMESRI